MDIEADNRAGSASFKASMLLKDDSALAGVPSPPVGSAIQESSPTSSLLPLKCHDIRLGTTSLGSSVQTQVQYDIAIAALFQAGFNGATHFIFAVNDTTIYIALERSE